METDDTGTAMTTFLEMKNSNEDLSYVLLFSLNKTGTGALPQIESACSSNMKGLAEDEEVRTKFLNALARTSEVKEPKKLKDELPKKCHDLHNKQTVGQEHGAVNDKIPGLRSSSRRHRFLSDGDLPDKKHEISVSFQESKELPPPLLPGATEVTETITNSNITTDMKAQSTSATGTRSKAYTEASDTIPFGGTFQDETTSTDKVPTVTTNSRLDINKEEPWTDVISSMRMFSTKPLDAKAAAVNATCPMSRNAKALTETPTSNDPATYPDGCVARKMPGEPRTDSKPAKSWHEWKNEKKLRFIQDVNGWKHKSTSKYRSFVRDLEKGGAKIVKGNWTRRISEKILKAMQRPHVKIYDGSSVKELLRFIRNAFSHYHDLTEDAKSSLGKSRDKIMDYFTDRFPMLLDHTYHVMEQFSEEDDFRPYY